MIKPRRLLHLSLSEYVGHLNIQTRRPRTISSLCATRVSHGSSSSRPPCWRAGVKQGEFNIEVIKLSNKRCLRAAYAYCHLFPLSLRDRYHETRVLIPR
jgi:hypothetical protein